MGSIKTSTGLASGIDTAALIKALLVNNQAAVTKIQNRQQAIQASQTGLSAVQAGLLSLSTSAQVLSNQSTFKTLAVQNSAPSQLSVSTTSIAAAGTQQFQTVRLATTDQSLSRGFADSTQQLGLTGQIVIGNGGSLVRPTPLDLLNDGAGVRRGTIRITDRSGATAAVDLSKALTVDDVVQAINSQSAISVQASTQGGKIVLQDTSGQTTSNLTVRDLTGGQTAADLGIAQSVADTTLTGSSVYQVSSDVSLASINDGNGLRLRSGSAADLSISLSDGTNLQIDLDGAKTVGDVIKKINNATSNGGKLTAALTNGRLQLTDNSGGSGTLTVDAITGTNASQVLGLDTSASGNVLTGKSLSGGLNSVLLRNLRGGQGIATPGSITLTDRTGATATVDLSQAESLDDVLSAINNATTSGNVKLQLHAAIDAKGTGITVTDTSGQTASNLVIGDVGGGTVANDLNIAVNTAQNAISSGSLRLRSVNEGTLLNHYSPSGGSVSPGSFSITDAAGESAVITLGSAVQTVGDVIDRINAGGINVTAQLNDTGDGFVLVDNSTGTGTLRVQGIGGSTAADLHLLGDAVTGTDGKQRISSRDAAVVKITADDTLTSISTKINSAGGQIRSSVIDSGSAINPFRLSLSSSTSGSASRLIIDDNGLGFNFSKQVAGQDAVLRIGSDPASAFLKTSSTNQFNDAVTGYNVTLLQTSDAPATVSTSLDTSSISAALSNFAKNYNSMASQIDTLTKYDTSTQTRGALQGDIGVLQVEWNITSLVNQQTGASNSPIRSLADVGLTVGAGGQLSFDPSVFQQAIAEHPQDVVKLLSDSKSGFGSKLNSLLTDLNDSKNGSITLEANAYADHIQSLQDQIDRMNDSMASKQTFLENQFANMESLVSGLQSQQDALTALASIATQTTSSKSNS